MLSLKDDPNRWKMLPDYLAALKKHNMRLTAIHARFYIEDGSFDMVPLVRTLRDIAYQGPLGTMGYTQSGDIPGKLKRAFQAWDRIRTAAE